VLIARLLAKDHWQTLTIGRGESASFNERAWGTSDYKDRTKSDRAGPTIT
jgi:hypothetical protein